MKTSIRFKNTVTVEHRNKAGELLHKETKENIVVNAGLEWLKAHLCSAASTPAKNIGLSSNVAAPAAGDTELGATVKAGDTSGLKRALGTYAAGATGVCTVAKTFTCLSGPETVASAGLYWHVSEAATLLAGVAITSATLQTDDTLTVTWTITLS